MSEIKTLKPTIKIECEGENCGRCRYRQLTQQVFVSNSTLEQDITVISEGQCRNITLCKLFSKEILDEKRLPECLESEDR